MILKCPDLPISFVPTETTILFDLPESEIALLTSSILPPRIQLELTTLPNLFLRFCP